MKVTDQYFEFAEGTARYHVEPQEVYCFHGTNLSWSKSFTPPLAVPFTLEQAEAVLNQALKEPGDEFERTAKDAPLTTEAN